MLTTATAPASATAFEDSARAAAARKASPKVHNAEVAARVKSVSEAMTHRKSPFAPRAAVQRRRFALPRFPTTTIGSFPQTAEVRKALTPRALDDAGYAAFLREETARTVRWQEEIGLDVLVHGEFERNDMVQYFGEQLAGFAFTQNAWGRATVRAVCARRSCLATCPAQGR